MATPLSNFQTAYQIASDYYLILLTAVNTQGDDVKAYSIEGQSITRHDVFEKMASLRTEMMELKRMIQMEDGAFEVHSYGVPI